MRTLIAALLAGLGISLAGCVVSAPVGVAPAPVGITIGWHGDQYYDGHRYWAHDDWMRSHPHDRDPRRDGDNHDEHRDY